MRTFSLKAAAWRWLVVGHRWLGIAICLLFAMWFATGLVMMYVGFPDDTGAERSSRLESIDLGQVRISPERMQHGRTLGNGVTAIDNVRVTKIAPWKLGRPIVAYYNGRNFLCDAAALPFPCAASRKVSSLYGWPDKYDPTTLTEQIAREAVAGGFNLVWINDTSQLAIAEAYGLRAILVLSGHQPHDTWFYAQSEKKPRTTWPYQSTAAQIDALIDRFRASPAAYAYFLYDEPTPSAFRRLGEIAGYLRQRDPAHLAYVTLLPRDAAPAQTRVADYDSQYLKPFIDVVNPGLLSYDSYQFLEHEDRSLYLSNLKRMALAARDTGVPFTNIVQAAAFDTGLRVPTEAQLRFLANSTLAFGAQGIFYFNYWSFRGPATGGIAPFADGKPTSIYTALQTINPQFERKATHLQRLKWIGTYLRGYQFGDGDGEPTMPRDMTQLPPRPVFDIPSLANVKVYQDGEKLTGALIGYFDVDGTRPGDATFAMIQNLDYDAQRNWRITASGPMSRFDAINGTWIDAGQNYIDVVLAPGEGMLVGLTSAVHAL